MAIMRPEATPTRPPPMEVLAVNLLTTCLARPCLRYSMQCGDLVQQSRDGHSERASMPKDQDFCASCAHGRSVEDNNVCDSRLGSSYPREEAPDEEEAGRPSTRKSTVGSDVLERGFLSQGLVGVTSQSRELAPGLPKHVSSIRPQSP